MYGIFHIRSVSVGLDSQIWYLFNYITGYLNVRKISETMDFRTLVGPLLVLFSTEKSSPHGWVHLTNILGPRLVRTKFFPKK